MAPISGRGLSKYILPEAILLHERENQAGVSLGTGWKTVLPRMLSAWVQYLRVLFFFLTWVNTIIDILLLLEARQEDRFGWNPESLLTNLFERVFWIWRDPDLWLCSLPRSRLLRDVLLQSRVAGVGRGGQRKHKLSLSAQVEFNSHWAITVRLCLITLETGLLRNSVVFAFELNNEVRLRKCQACLILSAPHSPFPVS